MRKTLFFIAAMLIASAVADVKLVTSEFTAKQFGNDAAAGWSVSGNKGGALTSTCGDSLFGGYNAFGVGAVAEKDYNSGVDHFELTINFDFYAVDSWDDETFSLFVDGNLVYSNTNQFNQPSPKPVTACGSGSWGERLYAVSVKFSHYRRNFNVRMQSTLNQDANDESWGIRNLQILARHGGGNSVLISDEFNQYDFKSSLEGWTLVDADASKVFTSCNGAKLFGGYNVFGKGSIASKTYGNLPGHYGVIFSFDLWLIDSPDGNDYVQVIADGQIYRFYRPDFNYGDNQNFLCGVQGWSERVVRVNLFVPHRGSSINFSIRAQFDENRDNESFGLRNLRVVTLGCSSARCRQITNEFNAKSFADAPEWTDPNNVSVSRAVAVCSDISFFGAHSTVAVQKSFQGLLPHTGVRIFFRVLAVGTWDASTVLQVLVNDVLTNVSVASEFTKNKVCSSDQESVRNYFVDVPHSSSFLDLQFRSTGFKGDTKYLIRDLTVTSYTEEGQQIVSTDFQQVNFDKAVGWTVTGNLANRLTTQCGKYSLFGGYNAFGLRTSATKTFTSLPTHDYVVVTFNMYFVDTWDFENFNIVVDDAVVKRITKSSTWGGHTHICGRTDSQEEIYFVQLYIPHSKDSLKLNFNDELNQSHDDESWGIRDLVVTVGNNLGAGQVSEPESDCVQIYTQCNFGGQSLSVCNDIPDLKALGWTAAIRSIYLPDGKGVQVYKSSQYKGDFKSINASESCLSGQNFLLVNKAFNVDVSNEVEFPQLRRQN